MFCEKSSSDYEICLDTLYLAKVATYKMLLHFLHLWSDDALRKKAFCRILKRFTELQARMSRKCIFLLFLPHT